MAENTIAQRNNNNIIDIGSRRYYNIKNMYIYTTCTQRQMETSCRVVGDDNIECARRSTLSRRVGRRLGNIIY